MLRPMHYPVMLENVLKAIQSLHLLRKTKIVDCNFGLGGHSNAILNKFKNSYMQKLLISQYTAYDLDSSIIQKYKNTPSLHTGDQQRLKIMNQNFTNVLNSNQKYDVLLADLGFNSVQLQQNNGFSWLKDSPLEMRYDSRFEACSQLVKRLSYIQLVDIMVKYGDLNSTQAKIVAKKIQQVKPIQTTFKLRDSIVGCFQSNKTRKIAQVFQALRIANNRQLQSLKQLCLNMDKVLNNNALVLIITFHSLERDLIYRQIKQKQTVYSKIKIQYPSKHQLQENKRSSSAQLLKFRKL